MARRPKVKSNRPTTSYSDNIKATLGKPTHTSHRELGYEVKPSGRVDRTPFPGQSRTPSKRQGRGR